MVMLGINASWDLIMLLFLLQLSFLGASSVYKIPLVSNHLFPTLFSLEVLSRLAQDFAELKIFQDCKHGRKRELPLQFWVKHRGRETFHKWKGKMKRNVKFYFDSARVAKKRCEIQDKTISISLVLTTHLYTYSYASQKSLSKTENWTGINYGGWRGINSINFFKQHKQGRGFFFWYKKFLEVGSLN